MRDYIHVVDLAEGHCAALQKIFSSSEKELGCVAINLGTGKGTRRASAQPRSEPAHVASVTPPSQ